VITDFIHGLSLTGAGKLLIKQIWYNPIRVNKPVIITIDDDPQVLRAVERDLISKYAKDYSVLKAMSGMEALGILSKLQARNNTVALFLVDQRMPELTGTQFIAKAKEIFPEARSVLLTAYADTEAAITSINDLA